MQITRLTTNDSCMTAYQGQVHKHATVM